MGIILDAFLLKSPHYFYNVKFEWPLLYVYAYYNMYNRIHMLSYIKKYIIKKNYTVYYYIILYLSTSTFLLKKTRTIPRGYNMILIHYFSLWHNSRSRWSNQWSERIITKSVFFFNLFYYTIYSLTIIRICLSGFETMYLIVVFILGYNSIKDLNQNLSIILIDSIHFKVLNV